MLGDSWPVYIDINNVRCFQSLANARVRPLTLLVGENSTGKTTLLGCYAVLLRMFHVGPFRLEDFDFNEAPFNLGSFKDIVRTQNRNESETDEFEIGLGYNADDTNKKSLSAIFKNVDGQPFLNSLVWRIDETCLRIERLNKQSLSVIVDGESMELNVPLEIVFATLRFRGVHYAKEDTKNIPKGIREIGRFFDTWWGSDDSREQFWSKSFLLRALAPLRASPERTYNPAKETTSPAGNHVPMMMMRLSRSQKKSWKKLHDQLVTFGEESGMFSDITVKNFGQDMSDPFQIQVKVRSNTHANLMDVGYGVSQCLPILVDVNDSKETQFILQQPEVHLHPRVQAELATFFVQSVNTAKNRFLIETHSDYIIDRVRINVRQGLIPADDVSILYFEPKEDSVAVHNLWMDKYGNLEGAPQGYRGFFLRESDLLLGFEK